MTAAVDRQAIHAWARDGAVARTLADPHARAVADNPVCGDRVTMEVRMAGDAIEALAHTVRGCVLSQAVAAVIGARAAGSDSAEIDVVRRAVAAMLDGRGEPPSGKWQDLALFAPVAEHRHRRHCVLLPFEALQRALDAVNSPA